MTAADEAQFIQLWQAGASYQAIAAALRCPLGTVASRSAALAAQGKITPRQHGGAKARQEGVPPPVQRLDRLEGEVQGLRQLVQSVVDRLDHPPVQTPVQITALPPYPQGKAVRGNVWILDAMRDERATWSAERGVSPSQLVQELLWKALTDQLPSTS
jgi:hypothetical protein